MAPSIVIFKKIVRSLEYRTKRLIETPFDMFSYYQSHQLSTIQKWFKQKLQVFAPSTDSKSESGIVLVQMVKDYEFTIKLAAAAKVLADKNNLRIQFYDVSWVKWIGRFDRYGKVHSFFFNSSLEKIYSAFGDKVAFRCEEKYRDQSRIRKKLADLRPVLIGIEDLLEFEVNGILIGDLIYDTYLRFYHKPTALEINNDLWTIIEVSLNIFYMFQEFLAEHQVKKYVTTYTTYIEHGIPTRLCLNSDIDVCMIGSISYVADYATPDFPYHANNHSVFSPKRKISEHQLQIAELKFRSRFSGKIDDAVCYMRTSSFLDNPIDDSVKAIFKKRSRNIVVYAHDFFDSPHVYRKLMFSDLYQFLKQTLNSVKDLDNTTVFIKPHPNGISEHLSMLSSIVQEFDKDHFYILPNSISNLNIVELAPDLVVTARGTVGIEMAYFQVPTVALFDNPYANFNFVHTCSTLEEYFSILKGDLSVNIDFNKADIYSFYYQAYLEKLDIDKNGFVTFLYQFMGKTYDDDYLKFLEKSKFFDSIDVFLQMFTDVIDDLDKRKIVAKQKL